MKNNLFSTASITIAFAVSPVALVPAFAHEDATRLTPTSAQGERATYDIQFLDTMSQHHRDGISMMELAVDRAQSSDVRTMAQKGIDDQSKEIEELKTMRTRLNDGALDATNMKLPGMMPKEKMDQEMAKLNRVSENQFDKAFLQSMIKHHQGAVKMSDDARSKAKHAEVKTNAQQIHDKQQREIGEMQKMLSNLK